MADKKRKKTKRSPKLNGQENVPPTKWMDILPNNAAPWEREKARHMDAVETRFRNRGPMVGEAVEQWIKREFAPLRDSNWRCPNCGYGGNANPDTERTAWCPDCTEERQMDIDDDKEWMFGEVETVSDLTKKWD